MGLICLLSKLQCTTSEDVIDDIICKWCIIHKYPPPSMQTMRCCCSSCRTMRHHPETPSTYVSTCPSLLAPTEPWPCSATTSFTWPTHDPLVPRTHGTPAKFTPVSYWTSRVELYPTITGWYTDGSIEMWGTESLKFFLLVKIGSKAKIITSKWNEITAHSAWNWKFVMISDDTGRSDF